jgi:hypothetical protein
MLCPIVLPFGVIIIYGRIQDIVGMVPAVKNRSAHGEKTSKPKLWARDLTPNFLVRNQQIIICIFTLPLQC